MYVDFVQLKLIGIVSCAQMIRLVMNSITVSLAASLIMLEAKMFSFTSVINQTLCSVQTI